MTPPASAPVPPLRVLLAGRPTADQALKLWLADVGGIATAGPAASVAEMLALAADFKPRVVLLDFHGLPMSTAYVVKQIKALSPCPLVFVLTHDASPAMRRRCREARVDEVYEKTTELEALGEALKTQLEENSFSSGETPGLQP